LLAASVSVDNTNTPSLRPGIYLLIVNNDLGLVIHWPEIGCYEGNASSKLEKNMINLHRCYFCSNYFTKNKNYFKKTNKIYKCYYK
jgi:hypothetical protein